jgi:hypothetical protein
VRRGLAVFAFLFAVVAPLAAQAASLSLLLQDGVPRIQANALLADGKFLALMRSGFPLRLHYRLELWRKRSSWFDEHSSEASWDLVARYDPLSDDFLLVRSGGARRFASSDQLGRALAIPYKITLTPKGSGRFYYLCRLEVSTLNDTDLREVEQWLKGEVSPAVSGKADLGDAVVRGAQRILVRIAGLPRLTLETRSPLIERK